MQIWIGYLLPEQAWICLASERIIQLPPCQSVVKTLDSGRASRLASTWRAFWRSAQPPRSQSQGASLSSSWAAAQRTSPTCALSPPAALKYPGRRRSPSSGHLSAAAPSAAPLQQQGLPAAMEQLEQQQPPAVGEMAALLQSPRSQLCSRAPAAGPLQARPTGRPRMARLRTVLRRMERGHQAPCWSSCSVLRLLRGRARLAGQTGRGGRGPQAPRSWLAGRRWTRRSRMPPSSCLLPGASSAPDSACTNQAALCRADCCRSCIRERACDCGA